MGTWTSNNKLNLTGSITSGLVLSSSNADSGTVPTDMTLTTYNDFNYDADYYELKAIFEGAYTSDYFANSVEWTATSVVGSLKYQYALSNDGVSYDAWSPLSSAILTKSIILSNKYFKLRFIFDGGNWSDSDYLKIFAITSSFTPFVKNTVIEANEMNANFSYIGQGDLLPKGGIYLTPTSGSYNIGSSTYPWNTIYCENVYIESEAKKSLTLIAKAHLSATATRVEFAGLNGDDFGLLILMAKLRVVNNTTSGYDLKLVFNNDSATNYGYYGLGNTATTSFIAIHTFNTTTGVAYNDMLECYIKTRSGNEKMTISQQICDVRASTAPTLRITTGIYSQDTTVTSIVLYTSAVLLTDTTFYLYGMTI